MKMLALFSIFTFSFSVFAVTGRTTYQAKIIKPDGQPLEASSVNFRFTILDPAASCVLYIEDYAAVNMTGTSGLISFALGAGTRTYPVSATAFASIFDNSTVSFPCQSPGIYTPTPTDARKIVMQFQDTSGWQTLPAMTINAVPFAMYAAKSTNSLQLNGKADTAFVEKSTLAALNCNPATHAITFNGVSFSCIAVGGGGGGGGITSVTTSGTVLSTGGTASAPVISITAATMSSDGYLTSLDYAEFKAKLSASRTQIINTLGYAPVSGAAVATQISNSNLSGDVSGTISSNSVVSVGGKTSAQVSNSVDDTLAATTSATANTIVKRNSSGNATFADIYASSAKINYVDIYRPSTSFNIRLQAPTSLSANYTLMLPTSSGTLGQVLSTDGNGNLSWSNPSTGSVTSVSATAPLVSTGGSAPTISITQATSSTSGYLSASDFNTFNNKQTATSAAVIATLGYTPADNAASGTYAQKANNLSDLTSSATARSNLGLGTLATGNSIDLGSASATGIIAEARLQTQSNVTSGTPYTKVTVDGKGRVTSGAQLSSSDVTTALGYTPATSTTLAASFVQKTGDTMTGLLNLPSNGLAVGTNQLVVSGSNVGVGVLSPTAFLEVKAGTTSFAPLKLTSGTLLSSAQSGTIEYDGSRLYFTDGSNTRRAVATNSASGSFDNTSAISNTSGNITLSPNNITGSVIVNSSAASISSGTGALVVNGGVGIAGNINAGGNLNLTGSATIGQSLQLSSMTSGSLLFAGASGLVSEDNSRLFWDGANKRLGLGTNSPAQTLSVSGTGYFSGNVGIGTANPGNSRAEIFSQGVTNDKVLKVTGSGVTGGQTGPFYGVYIDAPANNNATARYGIYADGNGGGSGSNYGVYGTTTMGSSTRLAVGVQGHVLVNSAAVNNAPTMSTPVAGVMATASTTGISMNAVTTALLARNETVYGAISYGAYIDAVSGPTTVIPLRIDYNTSEIMRVTSSGNVGIGTTTPLARLDIAGQDWSGSVVQTTRFAAGPSTGGFWGLHSRGAAVGTYAPLLNGDSISDFGAIGYFGAAGSDTSTAGHITVGAEGDWGAANKAGFIKFMTAAATGSNTEKMRITSSGNVGIGTASPGTALQVGGGTGLGDILLKAGSSVAGDAGDIIFQNNAGTQLGRVWTDSTSSTLYLTGRATNSPDLALNSSGNVGIGTTSPGYSLDVVGSTAGAPIIGVQNSSPSGISGLQFKEQAGSTRGYVGFNNSLGKIILGGPNAADVSLMVGNAERLTASSNGNVGIGTTTPASKLHVVTAASGTAATFSDNTNSTLRIQHPSAGILRFDIDGGNQFSFANAGTERVRIDGSGNVGIGTVTPRAGLDVNSTIIGKPAVSNGTSTIDFATGNKQYTSASCGAFIFHNMKDGGDFVFVSQGVTAATCTFTAYSDAGTTALTVHMPPDNGNTTASKHTIFNMMVVGTHLYVAWTPGY